MGNHSSQVHFPAQPKTILSQNTTESHPVINISSQDGETDTDLVKYRRLRDTLFSFAVGEAAYDYSKRLLKEQPDNPALLALVSETIIEYERKKVKKMRSHWCDRMDVLQEGIDLSRSCVHKHPEYGPCWRNYALLSVRMADQEFRMEFFKPFGVLRSYKNIIKRGKRALDLNPDCSLLPERLGGFAARAAQSSKWWSPYRLCGLWWHVPTQLECLEDALEMHVVSYKLEPSRVENVVRLGMAYYQLGKWNEARKWYRKARDEMLCEQDDDSWWQAVAHTHLTAHFSGDYRKNIPH